MGKKAKLFKEMWVKNHSLDYFSRIEDSYLSGGIILDDEDKTDVYTSFYLDDETFYNQLRVMIAQIDLSKKYEALELINELNIKYISSGSNYFFIESKGKLVIVRKFVYIADTNSFNPEKFMNIFIVVLRELARDDMPKIKKLI